ncbi:restriction endonuclease subunit M [Candidatus Woesearchaeota archaeon]|jgi:DNA modification methylase|nr:restriction endonuclease subunit M [Bacteroidota bacterium]MBT7558689.1 restriction endonuclease subunit M [Candidatus Woesearchaeota archaeon]
MLDTIEENIRNNFDSAKAVLGNLKKIGRIDEEDISYDIFIKLLQHKNRDVRVEAIKNLGKFSDNYIQSRLKLHYQDEKDSLVKRECVSSLGRQRNKELIEFFIETLQEKDPKIVLQSIRALLVFKNDDKVKKALNDLLNHPNEMIKEVLEIELTPAPKRPKEKHVNVDLRLKNTVVNGDVLDVLREIKEESFHLTFTSPPYYNARDYSFYSSYQEYLDFSREVFKETHRLTKNGRFLIVNTSPVIVPRVSRKHSSRRYPIPFDIHNFLMQDGWDFIDDIIWQKPEYSVKNRVGGFMQHRKPLGYKPNSITEYLMVYRKKSRDLIDWNIKQYPYSVIEESKVKGDFETTNVWNLDPTFDKTHSAVFPKSLCERIIDYYSYKNDLVFDPFGGSGTFGEVAARKGRNYFLTEIDKEYFARIKEKLNQYETKYLNIEDFKKWMKQEK